MCEDIERLLVLPTDESLQDRYNILIRMPRGRVKNGNSVYEPAAYDL